MTPKPYTAHSYRDAAGDWRWNIKAPNGRIVADSGEGYATRSGAHRALAKLRTAILRLEPPPAVRGKEG